MKLAPLLTYLLTYILTYLLTVVCCLTEHSAMPRHQTSPADDVIALSDDVVCTEAAQCAESLTSETNGDTDANQSTSPVLDEGYDSITHESITKLPVCNSSS